MVSIEVSKFYVITDSLQIAIVFDRQIWIEPLDGSGMLATSNPLISGKCKLISPSAGDVKMVAAEKP